MKSCCVCVHSSQTVVWHRQILALVLLAPLLFHTVLGTCGDYPVVDNSRNDATSGPPFASGVTISYTCKNGYIPSGGHQVTCNGDQWDPFYFQCTPVSCGDPGAPANGRRIGTVYTFGSEVTFECNTGYKMQGRRSTFCTSDQTWTNPTPACNAVTCPAVVTPEHGSVFPTNQNSFNTEVRYSCNVGYEWSGTEGRRCQADKTWSGEDGTCEVVDCGEPPELYGVTYTPTGNTQHGSVIIFRCSNGAQLVGANMAECSLQGDWTEPTPKCYQKCSSVVVQNGEFDGLATSNHNTAVRFRCNEGYRTNPSSGQVTCNNATWTPNTPECQKIPRCPDPGLPVNGSRNQEPPYYVDTRLTYRCPVGFNIIGADTLICQNDETWTTNLPDCQQVKCDPLHAPKHGWLQPNDSVVYGVTVRFFCDDKYKWSDHSNARQCQVDGQWSGSEGQCTQEEDKPQLPLIPIIVPLVVVAVILGLVAFLVPNCKVNHMLKRELYTWESKYRGADEQQQLKLKSILAILEKGEVNMKPPPKESGEGDHLLTETGQVKVTTVVWLEQSLQLERSPGCCPCWGPDIKQRVLAYQLLYLAELAVDICDFFDVHNRVDFADQGDKAIYLNSDKLANGDPSLFEQWHQICDSKAPCGIVFLPVDFNSLKLYIRKDTVTPSQYQPKFMEVHYLQPDTEKWFKVGVVNVKATHSPLTVPGKSVTFNIYPQVQNLDHVVTVL